MKFHNLFISICLFFYSYSSFAFNNSSKIFPEIPGWKIENFKSYTSNDLYTAINGAAELFLKYNFIEMSRADYLRDSNYITVEVYEHETPIDAFGVYSRERPDKNIYFEIGVQGYKEYDYLYFNAGQYYIKIRTLKLDTVSQKAMQDIAGGIALQLNGNAVFPQLFDLFPLGNKVIFSEKYYNESILGFDFLHSSYEVTYKKDNQEFVLFILEGEDEEDANKMIAGYFAYFKIPFEENKRGFFILDDRYNGEICILKKNKYLICSRGQIDAIEGEKLLLEIGSKLK
jgi:hypothetical protein